MGSVVFGFGYGSQAILINNNRDPAIYVYYGKNHVSNPLSDESFRVGGSFEKFIQRMRVQNSLYGCSQLAAGLVWPEFGTVTRRSGSCSVGLDLVLTDMLRRGRYSRYQVRAAGDMLDHG